MAKIMTPLIQDSKSFSSVDMITLIDLVTSDDKELGFPSLVATES